MRTSALAVTAMMAATGGSEAVAAASVGKKELPELRSRASQTFALPDGRRMVRVSPEPLNWWNTGTRKWERIDTTFGEAHEPGVLGRSRNRFTVDVPERAGGTARVAHGGRWVAFRPLNMDGAGRLVGSEARYRISDAASLTYESTETGLKEFVRITNATAGSNLRYRLDVSEGMTVRWRHGGGLGAYDEQGTLRFALTPPAMFDATGAQGPVRYGLTGTGSARILAVEPDARWLRDSARRFPITIDPDIVWIDQGVRVEGAGLDCTRRESMPTTSSCGLPTLEAGQTSSGGVAALMRFDLANAVPPGATISEARLGLYAISRQGTGTSQLAATTLQSSWTSAATWNTRNGTSAWTGADYGGSRPITLSSTGRWYTWDLTERVSRWNSLIDDNFGLQINNWSGTSSFTFGSTDGSAAQRPHLEILYTPGVGSQPQFTFIPIETNADHAIAVNVANGNVKLDAFDAALHGVGRGFARSYNSLGASAYEGKHGAGWTSDFGDVGPVTQSDGTIVFTAPGGTRIASWANRDGCRRVLDPQWFETCPSEDDPTYFDSRVFESTTESWLSYTEMDAPGYRLREDDEPVVSFASGAVTDPLEESQNTYTTDANGLYSQLALADGGDVQFEYLGGKLVQVVRPDASDLTYEYGDVDGNLTAVESVLGRVTFTYGPGGRVASVQHGTDTWTFSYTSGATTVTAPGSSATTYSYGPNGQVFDPDSAGPDIDFGSDAAGIDGETDDEVGNGIYVDGSGTATFAARVRDARSGVKRVSLLSGSTTIATSTAPACVLPAPQTCLSLVSVSDLSFPDAALAAGAHTYEIEAEDADGNVSTLPVKVFVDRSSPGLPGEIEIAEFSPTTGETLVAWEDADDVALPGDVPGAGVEYVRARYQRADTTWTSWINTQEGELAVVGFTSGASALIQLQAIDEVGNAGAVWSDSVVIGPPQALPGSESISGAGTASLRVTLTTDTDSWVPGQRLASVPIVIRSAGEEVSSRTDANGEAVFPGLPPGDYEVDTDGPGTRVVTLAGGVQTTVAVVESPMMLTEYEGASAALAAANPLQSWCDTNDSRKVQRTNLCLTWSADASIAMRTVNHLYNVKVITNPNNPRAVRQGNDNTKANAFMHMYWNALGMDAVSDSLLVTDEKYWADRQAYAFDTLYERAQGQRREFGERRASKMDVWNNGIGRRFVRVRVIEPANRDLEDWQICEGIRRIAKSVELVKWAGKRSLRLINRNRLRPVFISAKGKLADGSEATARLKQKSEFESGRPCRPIRPFRVARAAQRY